MFTEYFYQRVDSIPRPTKSNPHFRNMVEQPVHGYKSQIQIKYLIPRTECLSPLFFRHTYNTSADVHKRKTVWI